MFRNDSDHSEAIGKKRRLVVFNITELIMIAECLILFLSLFKRSFVTTIRAATLLRPRESLMEYCKILISFVFRIDLTFGFLFSHQDARTTAVRLGSPRLTRPHAVAAAIVTRISQPTIHHLGGLFFPFLHSLVRSLLPLSFRAFVALKTDGLECEAVKFKTVQVGHHTLFS